MPRHAIYDRWLFVTTVVLVVGGLFMVGSASNYLALDHGKSPSAFWWKQALHLLLGFAVLLAALSIPYRRLASPRVVTLLLVACLAGLILVIAMPPTAGVHRWIPIGPFKLQPSEFAKLLVVLFVAFELSRKEERIDDLWTTLPSLLVVGVMAFLVVIEPDLGSAIVMVLVSGAMVFAAGLRWKYVLASSSVVATGIFVSVWAEPYRLRRVTAFLDPWADPHDTGFQLIQSLIAFGNGGVTGVGLGQSQQKAFFLPAAHTDFIFSVVGEELGLIGAAGLLLAFLVLFWRGLRAARGAPDRFGSYLALGLTVLLVSQGLVNMCVCVGLLPTKGLSLPFISYGGSSLLASMTAMGLLLNVSQHSN